ncbi:MAG: bifunctional phosphopantothenoylcysteine decarboxylase/phosphopantothenate--cysteine ligase CoaBC [Acidiferrobacterales bacterium]|nr:bifunctional phosphopantothenoylcysteine decarboxylase/phosphopantothenate--cysteine ligase CoaBC [Acidiferrobacterales bacterium]
MFIHKNKRVLVGVTGGIAAYKSPELVRRLKDRGCDVRVVMSEGAKAFITPLTLQAVSGNKVHEELLDEEAELGMGHIELARWAEQIVIAPATANFIAKLAAGRADDLLSTLVLATSAEIAVAPAMNQQMWQHPSTAENLSLLQDRGVRVIGPGSGDQACGEVGPGRMTDPTEIATLLAGEALARPLVGKRVLITAGPTWEAMDPVRGITNHSSGKMGFALAEAALDCGAEVTLVSGPVHLETPAGATRIDVRSAQNMLEAVLENVNSADYFVAVAAVADYRPINVAEQKIKKTDESDEMTIRLVKNPDILATVGAMPNRPYCIGFAAETENQIAHARAKLTRKNVDIIAANNVAGDEGAFGSDQNAVTLIHHNGEIEIPTNDKYAVAISMWRHILKLANSA